MIIALLLDLNQRPLMNSQMVLVQHFQNYNFQKFFEENFAIFFYCKSSIQLTRTAYK